MAAWGPWLALGLIAIAQLLHSLQYRNVVDDAFIVFRYAENIAQGYGAVFNPGERVEGYTDFLWVALLAGLGLVGGSLPALAPALGRLAALALLPVCYWTGRRLGLERWTALLPCAAIAASSSNAMWSGAGLETPLYTLLFTAALGRALVDLEEQPSWPWSGVLYGLATLTRPEAAGLFALCAAYGFFCGRRQLAGRIVAGFALVFVPHALFRALYYGQPLPNTFYAKVNPGRASLASGSAYVGDFLLTHGGAWSLTALLGLSGIPGAARKRHPSTRLPLLTLAAAAAYVAAVGGDFLPHGRFCIPYLPWLVLLVCVGAARLGERLFAGKRQQAGSLALAALYSCSVAVPAFFWDAARNRKGDESIAATTAFYQEYGRWLRSHRPPTTLMAGGAMGIIPYETRFPTIDMLGLTDETIAHTPVAATRGASGHQRLNSEYLLSRKPDIVAVEFKNRQQDFDPATDVHTARIYELMVTDWNAWPALVDLVRRPDFQLEYAPRLAPLADGGSFFFLREGPHAARDARASLPGGGHRGRTRGARQTIPPARPGRRRDQHPETVAPARPGAGGRARGHRRLLLRGLEFSAGPRGVPGASGTRGIPPCATVGADPGAPSQERSRAPLALAPSKCARHAVHATAPLRGAAGLKTGPGRRTARLFP